MTNRQFVVVHETDDNDKPYNTPFKIYTRVYEKDITPLISAWRHSDYVWLGLDHTTQKTLRIRRRYKSDAVDVALFYATIAWHNAHPHP